MKLMEKLFSIIMCTYNSADTLKHAVESVLIQECTEWELIILDNGSKDDTVNLLKGYAHRYENIRCIYREDNVGWCKGLSICMEEAEGEYMIFLGADDLLAHSMTLMDVKAEIEMHHPDIVWTGFAAAMYEDGVHVLRQRYAPPYKVYEADGDTDKIAWLVEIMQTAYYDSIMHYVRIDHLKKNNINFFSPFYGDCQGMTEALLKAGKMVALDKVEYILTYNTSQTASRVGFDYNIEQQWNSIRRAVPDLRLCVQKDIRFVAYKILVNLVEMFQSIAVGVPLRDELMNPIEKTFSERFLRLELWLETDAFGEMIYYGGRQEHEECLIGAAGVCYMGIKHIMPETLGELHKESHWLADFVEKIFELDAQGRLAWRRYITDGDAAVLCETLKCEKNRHRIGCELLLREDVLYDNICTKRQIEEILEQYLAGMRG